MTESRAKGQATRASPIDGERDGPAATLSGKKFKGSTRTKNPLRMTVARPGSFVVESATMLTEPLVDFELSDVPFTPVFESSEEIGSSHTSSPSTPRPPVRPVRSPTSSMASTVTEALCSPLVSSSQTSTLSEWASPSSYTRNSQVSTASPPWSPFKETAVRGRDHSASTSSRRPGDDLTWYYEAFYSENSDDEKDAGPAEKPLTGATLSQCSTTSSDGFTIIEDTTRRGPLEEWRPASWPSSVEHLFIHDNPLGIRFRSTNVDTASCECKAWCNATTCTNARDNSFCTTENCVFAGTCGNALRESTSLIIAKYRGTGMRGLIATGAIPKGEIIGEYLGKFYVFAPRSKKHIANEGYRMQHSARTVKVQYAGINALDGGGILRFLNLSCNSSVRFHEVQTGDYLTVVSVTIRDIYPGEQVTVSYGNELWFICRCGWWGYQHYHHQHLPDILGWTPPPPPIKQR